MAMLEGAAHIVRYLNPAFCRLIDRTKEELLGKPFRDIMPEKAECLALLDRVYRTAKSDSYTAREYPDRRFGFTSYTTWPVMEDERIAGVMLQVTETALFYEQTVEMNEALMLASMRQHELTAAADESNVKLQTEIADRTQREHEAHMLTNEIAHRIKNNLQIVMSLIDFEARSTPAPCVQGYEAMHARIGAISELYDLISQSGAHGSTIEINTYLGEIARAMSASLLGDASGITIEIEAETLEIETDRAVPLGLLVNELVTNAIKHGFPGGTGRVVVRVKRLGDQIELAVADNGIGMKDKDLAKAQRQHGADYVAIFVRQLAATIAVSGSEEAGTIVRIRLPLRATPPGR